MTDLDLLVAGAGPAGLATAIVAARRGLSVTVVEPREGPIDKACGEGLMPGAVDALRALGVTLVGRPFHGIRYLDGPHVAESRFADGHGLGVRRTVLQEAMARRAVEVGVGFVRGRVTDLRQGPDGVEAVLTPADPASTGTTTLGARHLVAADGLHSPVRDLVGLRPVPRASGRYGIRRHVACAPWTDLVEVHWGERAEVYVTPVAEDTVGLAVLGPRGTDLDAALTSLPGLRARIDGAAVVSADRGAGPLRQDVRSRVAGRVLLVGDAAGYVDAITGEGVRLATLEAEAAVDCLVRGVPAEYERAWRGITARYRQGTGLLVLAAGRPALRRRIVPAAARFPTIFARCVERVAGEPEPSRRTER